MPVGAVVVLAPRARAHCAPASTTTARDHNNNNREITTTTQAARAELAIECDYNNRERDHNNNNREITTTTQAARAELAIECDYVREAASATRFKQMLSPYPEFTVPAVVPDLSSSGVLTTEWAPGAALDPCNDDTCKDVPVHVAMRARCCHVTARMLAASDTIYISCHVSQAHRSTAHRTR